MPMKRSVFLGFATEDKGLADLFHGQVEKPTMGNILGNL